MFFRKMALLAKIETAYGVDAVPTGALNAILASNVNINPLEVEQQERAYLQPFLGNSGKVVTSFYGKVDFEIEMAGSGAAGTAPNYGVLLRASSLAEVVTAGVKVAYTPVSSGFESASLYYFLDGVLHRLLGARGTVQAVMNAKSIPMWKFSLTGLFQQVTDVVLPTPDYTGYMLPLAVNKTNTPTFTLHGYAAAMAELSLDLANEIKYRNLVNSENVLNVDRSPSGNVKFETTLMATKNWFSLAQAQTPGALNIIHGTTAGNIIQIQAPNVQINAPRYEDMDGVAMLACGLTLMPGAAGNDEISIEIK